MTVFATLFAAAAAATASIAPAVDAPLAVRVATHDIDLSSAQGQRTLDLRLARAAARVCDTVDPRYAAAIRVSPRQCRDAAIAAARTANPATRMAAR